MVLWFVYRWLFENTPSKLDSVTRSNGQSRSFLSSPLHHFWWLLEISIRANEWSRVFVREHYAPMRALVTQQADESKAYLYFDGLYDIDLRRAVDHGWFGFIDVGSHGDLPSWKGSTQCATLPAAIWVVSGRVRAFDHRYEWHHPGLEFEFDRLEYPNWSCIFPDHCSENVQVAEGHLGTPSDIAVSPSDSTQVPPAWIAWARSSKLPTLVQLNHPGLQSTRGCGRKVWEPSIAPSSMRLSMGDSYLAQLLAMILFHKARAMSTEDIKKLVQQFRTAAILVYQSGFQGSVRFHLVCLVGPKWKRLNPMPLHRAQIHCRQADFAQFCQYQMSSDQAYWSRSGASSHGYLLAGFLSPRVSSSWCISQPFEFERIDGLTATSLRQIIEPTSMATTLTIDWGSCLKSLMPSEARSHHHFACRWNSIPLTLLYVPLISLHSIILAVTSYVQTPFPLCLCRMVVWLKTMLWWVERGVADNLVDLDWRVPLP